MMARGLMITFYQLHYASGIEDKILRKDIKNGTLNAQVIDGEELFWYRDATNYVHSKWKEGKVDMYPTSNEDAALRSFEESLLDKLDDGFSPAQIKQIMKLDKEGRRLQK